ncbi:MAG: FMN-binding protein [Patescibacteria group bacterium]|jgi:uncharacterized protein with FMN-binding domain|nr:FMN-binding protein [Patescibacteria group bacterium]
MKKIILSASIIIVFIGYAISQKGGTGQKVQSVAIAPTQNNTQSQPQANPSTTTLNNSTYKDGNYTGDSIDAYYGNVQVKATIQGGKVTDIQFLDYPKDRRTSQNINSQATPILKQEAIQVQNSNVDIVSGATLTSQAFTQSLQSALDQAKA